MSPMLRSSAAAIVCACGCVAAPAVGAQPADDPPPAHAASAAPRSVVRLLPRSGLAFGAWSASRDQYGHDYIYPTGWRLALDGCASLVDGRPIGLGRGPSPSWVLEPLDGQSASGRPVGTIAAGPDPDPAACSRVVTLPVLRRWRITMTVIDSAGAAASSATVMNFRDLLIAAVGDSFTSGEGGKTHAGNWADKQCDRSETPWPKLLVDLIEDSSTTVTYLNFACSGSDVSQLATDTYDGINGGRRLRPQISALSRALGNPLAASTRTVNLLLASTGINELGGNGIADVLIACLPRSEIVRALALLANPALALNAFLLELQVDCKQDLSGDVARLPELYDTVELAASARLKLGRMHVISYPARVFTDEEGDVGGCGAFGDIDDDEARWVTATVNALDRQVAQAALRHGWGFTATTGIFGGHGYCSDESWFHTPRASVVRQGDVHGTIHPTKSGQRATATRVRASVRLDNPAPAPARLRVHFLRVRVSHRGPLRRWSRSAVLGVSAYPSPCRHHARALSLTLNVWKDVSANRCLDYDITTPGRTIGVSALTFLFEPGERPEEPRVPPGGEPAAHASAADPDFYFPVRRLHRRRDGWDATSASAPACVLQHAAGKRGGVVLEIEYEIATSGPLGPAPCPPRPQQPVKRARAPGAVSR